MSRAVMQQALEALMMMRDKYEEYACPACDHADAAITALRAAIAEPENQSQSQADTKVNPAEPEQGPVPWEQFLPDIGKPQTTHWEGCEAVHPECRKPDTDCHLQGVCQRSGYTLSPTPRKPQYDEQEMLRRCPHFDDPMRREMWITGFKAAHGITGEGS